MGELACRAAGRGWGWGWEESLHGRRDANSNWCVDVRLVVGILHAHVREA
jgi:hypothetical protein